MGKEKEWRLIDSGYLDANSSKDLTPIFVLSIPQRTILLKRDKKLWEALKEGETKPFFNMARLKSALKVERNFFSPSYLCN